MVELTMTCPPSEGGAGRECHLAMIRAHFSRRLAVPPVEWPDKGQGRPGHSCGLVLEVLVGFLREQGLRCVLVNEPTVWSRVKL